MIELRRITKSYKTEKGINVVLDDVSAIFPKGENFGILGRNGAGKSTLLRIISGVEMPDYGEVVRKGRISWPLGFSGGFNGSLSGEENCRFVARIYGEDIDRVVEFATEFSELGQYFHMPIRTYSSGMKARLAFGLSMAIDFNIYLVDEVTAVGDKRFQEKCRLAFEERQARSSVLMVSHNLKTITQYCKRAAVLDQGKLTFYDSIKEARLHYDA
ncbi:MAG: ABC transporter ATP-binding protein [Myxococcota bacterium]|jgi:capsular polysaccharide transport system ATP-binding protein|nr:ABC transporter ATP-binding protein [Myxococcota bacterium]